jgi:hypothetical protein
MKTGEEDMREMRGCCGAREKAVWVVRVHSMPRQLRPCPAAASQRSPGHLHSPHTAHASFHSYHQAQ